MRLVPLLLVALPLSLAFLAVTPSASAEVVTTINCGAGTDVWEVDYVCTVDGFGGNGELHLCPPGFTCVGTRYCYVTLSPLDVRCV